MNQRNLHRKNSPTIWFQSSSKPLNWFNPHPIVVVISATTYVCGSCVYVGTQWGEWGHFGLILGRHTGHLYFASPQAPDTAPGLSDSWWDPSLVTWPSLLCCYMTYPLHRLRNVVLSLAGHSITFRENGQRGGSTLHAKEIGVKT